MRIRITPSLLDKIFLHIEDYLDPNVFYEGHTTAFSGVVPSEFLDFRIDRGGPFYPITRFHERRFVKEQLEAELKAWKHRATIPECFVPTDFNLKINETVQKIRESRIEYY
jgi:hypothetical protein